jgi:hypothetical protein
VSSLFFRWNFSKQSRTVHNIPRGVRPPYRTTTRCKRKLKTLQKSHLNVLNFGHIPYSLHQTAETIVSIILFPVLFISTVTNTYIKSPKIPLFLGTQEWKPLLGDLPNYIYWWLIEPIKSSPLLTILITWCNQERSRKYLHYLPQQGAAWSHLVLLLW